VRDIVVALRFVLAAALRQSRGRMLAAFALLLLGSVSAPLTAVGLKRVTNDALRGDAHAAVLAGIATALVMMFSLTAGGVAHHLYFRVSENLQVWFDIELSQLANATTSLAHFDSAGFADRMDLVRQDGNLMWNGLEQILSTLANLTAIVTAAVLLARTQPLLLLLPVFAIPPLLGGRWATRYVERVRLEEAEGIRRARHLFALAIDPEAGKELRLFGLSDEVRRRQDELWERTTERLVHAQLVSSWFVLAGQLLFAAGYLGSVYVVVRQAIDGHRSAGAVVLVVALASQVNQQVGAVVATATQLQRVARAVERLHWLRALVAETEPATPKARVPERIERGIVLRDVSFRYPGAEQDALAGIDLELPPGTVVALVGENGAGKTTLVKLLCRFYDPTAGAIDLDGVSLSDVDPGEWRRRIAVGFQDFQRYELLVRENVGVGELSRLHDEEAIAAAVREADGVALVDGLPDGLDTQLGTNWVSGVDLSGGQWQKLAIGRAMMRPEPLLLVLDEPTSALDAHAEHALFERYAAATRAAGALSGAISVFTSHRFSTVRMADLILVVDGGRVAERGTHDELIALDGVYAELFAVQEAAYR
jgi:ATP-binding cassette subfamily B protein